MNLVMRENDEKSCAAENVYYSSANEAVIGSYSISSPAARRSLGATVTRAEAPLRSAVNHLVAAGDVSGTFDRMIQSSGRLLAGGESEPSLLRVSWLIAVSFVLHRARCLQADAHDAVGAVCWFFGDEMAEGIFTSFPALSLATAFDAIRTGFDSADLVELLPLVTEPFGHVTRNKLANCEVSKQKRADKRETGTFYTPSDVADYLVKEMTFGVVRPTTWLDPACGTGMLLRSVVRRQLASQKLDCTESRLRWVSANIFGIDKSMRAVDMCALVILLECILPATDGDAEKPFSMWKKIRDNIVCGDALELVAPDRELVLGSSLAPMSLAHIFSNLNRGRFSRVVMNPPYASKKVSREALSKLSSFTAQESKSIELHIAFVEIMYMLLTESGAAAAILPLAIGSNTGKAYKNLRAKLMSTDAETAFLFFDREPQSIFGEDVKTRATIVLVKKGGGRRVMTSGLLRWRAEERATIFSKPRLREVDRSLCSKFIPKLASQEEVDRYTLLKSCARARTCSKPKLGKITYHELFNEHFDGSKTMVLISGTAYNFISCFMPVAAIGDTDRFSSSALHALQSDSESEAFAAYAILSSRTCFWMWGVEGDGFHLGQTFIEELPLWEALSDESVVDTLATLGRELWSVVSSRQTVSLNGGKTTISYNPLPIGQHIIASIDQALGAHFGWAADPGTGIPRQG